MPLAVEAGHQSLLTNAQDLDPPELKAELKHKNVEREALLATVIGRKKFAVGSELGADIVEVVG